MGPPVYIGDTELAPDDKGGYVVPKQAGSKGAWNLILRESTTRRLTKMDMPPSQTDVEAAPGAPRGKGTYKVGDQVPERETAFLHVAAGAKPGWYFGLEPLQEEKHGQPTLFYRAVLVKNRVNAAKLMESWSYNALGR